MSTYAALASSADGRRLLSKSRLRYRVLASLERALADAGITKTELSGRLGLRKSAVSQVFGGDGNLRVNTIAEYLDALDCELEVRVVPAGTARARAVGAPSKPRLAFSAGTPLGTFTERGCVRADSVRPAAGAWGPRAVNG